MLKGYFELQQHRWCTRAVEESFWLSAGVQHLKAFSISKDAFWRGRQKKGRDTKKHCFCCPLTEHVAALRSSVPLSIVAAENIRALREKVVN